MTILGLIMETKKILPSRESSEALKERLKALPMEELIDVILSLSKENSSMEAIVGKLESGEELSESEMLWMQKLGTC
jgi:hypothetical protein